MSTRVTGGPDRTGDRTGARGRENKDADGTLSLAPEIKQDSYYWRARGKNNVGPHVLSPPRLLPLTDSSTSFGLMPASAAPPFASVTCGVIQGTRSARKSTDLQTYVHTYIRMRI